jgi:(R,R)-butanediol dehydrogenase/meso-butanediol dehydrogenase/diacetyl reductase
MKALVYHGRQDLRYQSVPKPSPRPGEVLVKVKYAGMCHTDFNEYANGPIFVSQTPHARTGRSVPLVLGHEFSGQIVQTGDGASALKAGDRVAVNAVDSCGACPYCIRGQGALCSSAAYIGFNLDGGFAEFATVPAACCHVLLDTVPYRDAVLVEPLSVAVHAVRRAGLEMGASVAIVGGGTLGLCMLQTARAAGARQVFVIEQAGAKRRPCELLGGTFLNSKANPGFLQEVFDGTGGRGVEVSFECAGAPAALKTAVEVTRPGGLICVTGIFPGPFPFDFNQLLAGEKTIVMSLAYGNEFPATIAMLADKRLRADTLITDCVPLSSGCEYIRDFETRGAANIKTLLEIDSQT